MDFAFGFERELWLTFFWSHFYSSLWLWSSFLVHWFIPYLEDSIAHSSVQCLLWGRGGVGMSFLLFLLDPPSVPSLPCFRGIRSSVWLALWSCASPRPILFPAWWPPVFSILAFAVGLFLGMILSYFVWVFQCSCTHFQCLSLLSLQPLLEFGLFFYFLVSFFNDR